MNHFSFQNNRNSGQNLTNAPISCYHRFQPDRSSLISMIYLVRLGINTDVTSKRDALILPFCISFPFPSWHHPHQTPRLCPFRADVVFRHMQDGQRGVVSQGLGQGLAGDTHDLRNTMKYTAHACRKIAKCFHSCVCFSIGQHHNLLSRKRGFLVFDLWNAELLPENISKLFSNICLKSNSKHNISTKFIQDCSIDISPILLEFIMDVCSSQNLELGIVEMSKMQERMLEGMPERTSAKRSLGLPETKSNKMPR